MLDGVLEGSRLHVSRPNTNSTAFKRIIVLDSHEKGLAIGGRASLVRAHEEFDPKVGGRRLGTHEVGDDVVLRRGGGLAGLEGGVDGRSGRGGGEESRKGKVCEHSSNGVTSTVVSVVSVRYKSDGWELGSFDERSSCL